MRGPGHKGSPAGLDSQNLVPCIVDAKVLQVVWLRALFTARAAQTLERVVRSPVFLGRSQRCAENSGHPRGLSRVLQ